MRRFGFDLGTQSIGWCVIDVDEKKETYKLDNMGVRIFSDGRDPKTHEPLNGARRQARSLRRNIERRKRRRQAMYRLISKYGLSPSGEEGKQWRNFDPYKLRSEALQRDLTDLELGRILMNLATRRGFKSNRKTDKKDSEAKGQALRQENLQAKLGSRTLGQYLYSLKQADEKAKLRFRADSEFYPTRAMYEDEFTKIRTRQEKAHPKFDWDGACRIIFFQRPLKRPERAACTFYPDQYRGYKAQPSAQIFRILQDIADLNYLDSMGRPQDLCEEDKEWLFEELNKHEKLGFDKLHSKLNINGPFSLESNVRKELKGNSTSIQMRKVFGPSWDKMPLSEQDQIVEDLIIEDDDTKLREMLASKGLSDEMVELALTKDFPVGTASLSAKFMRDVSKIMREKWCRYDEAVAMLNLHHSDLPHKTLLDSLPYYGEVIKYAAVQSKPADKLSEEEKQDPEKLFGRIPNPTVHIALNQLRKLVNALIERYGKPDEIHLEFATELKNGQAALKKIQQRQEENKKKNDMARAELRALQGKGDAYLPSREDIRRYLLWQELGQDQAVRTCVYCGKPISARQLINGEAEIEHIIPFSQCLDNGMSNLTVAHKKCNDAKGNRTPFDAFGTSPRGFDWEGICERAKKFYPRKRAKFAARSLDELRPKDFVASQMTDNAYIAKAACDYLSCICPKNKITAIPGMLTAEFRHQWGFNTILSSGLGKNRSDHRHHAIDALVIALTDRSNLQAASIANSRDDRPGIKAPPCPVERDEVLEQTKDILVSFKPNHGKGGALLQQTAYGFSQKESTDETGKTTTEHYDYRIRKAIRALSWSDIKDNRIVDKDISEKLCEYMNTRQISDPKAIEEKRKYALALDDFAKKTGIEHVRIEPKNKDESAYLHLGPGKGNRKGFKAYQYSDILCADIWMIPGKAGKVAYQADYFTRMDVPEALDEPEPRRPDNRAKRLMRLFKNDTLCIRHDGRVTYARVAGFSATDNKLDLQPIYSSDNCEEWLKSTASTMTDFFWKPKKGQYYLSVNSLFQQSSKGDSISKVSIAIDGRIRRR